MTNMQTHAKQLWLGVWLFILPFLGIPGVWKERLVAATGLILIGVALYVRYGKKNGTPSSTIRETSKRVTVTIQE